MERARLMDRTRNCTQKRDTIASLCLENPNGNKTAALTKKYYQQYILPKYYRQYKVLENFKKTIFVQQNDI